MIAGLKPYPEYKESGVPWLGHLPGHWTTAPGFAVFREKQFRNIGMKEKTVLSLSYGRIVVKPPEKLHGLVPESFETYQVVDPGDIIIRSTDLQNDWNSMRVGLVRDRGIITSAYLCFRTTGGLRPDFGYQMLHTFDLLKVFYGLGSGLRQNLDFGDFKRMLIFIPPPDEQAAIMQFLVYVNGRLEQAIRAKRKVIALLNEQKQAITHRAVTRGLDPSVPVDPSGIPWLGNIPRTFKRTRLGRVCLSIRDGTHNPPPAVPGIHRLLSVRNVVGGRFVTRADDRTMAPSAYMQLQRSYTVEAGDVVVALVGGTTGKSAVVEPLDNVTVQRSLGILRPNLSLIRSQFLHLLISSPIVQDQIRRIMGRYAAQPGIYLDELGCIQVIFPSLKEQAAIEVHVEMESVPIARMISRLEREINLLREYRTRLVADVVTGKLDVREAAARLPEEGVLDTAGEPGDLEEEVAA